MSRGRDMEEKKERESLWIQSNGNQARRETQLEMWLTFRSLHSVTHLPFLPLTIYNLSAWIGTECCIYLEKIYNKHRVILCLPVTDWMLSLEHRISGQRRVTSIQTHQEKLPLSNLILCTYLSSWFTSHLAGTLAASLRGVLVNIYSLQPHQQIPFTISQMGGQGHLSYLGTSVTTVFTFSSPELQH